MAAYARLSLAIVLCLSVFGVVRARAEAPAAPGVTESIPPGPDGPPGGLRSEADALAHEDAELIRLSARWHLARGDQELSRALLGVAYDKDELALYFGKQKELRAAVVSEGLGDFVAAAAEFRSLAKKDPLHAALALRIMSGSPERDAMFAEVVADVRGRVDRARRGESVPIYVTSKGEERTLEVIPDAQALDALSRPDADGEARFRYCYIDRLDLTGVDTSTLAARIVFDRCILGSVRIPNREVGALSVKGFVLGDFDVGKTWEGEVNKSKAVPGSRFSELGTRETVFLGRANFQDVAVTGRVARFPFTVFEGAADFRGARVAGDADFRFSTFGEGANFKRTRLEKSAFFGHTRFRTATRFSELASVQTVYFDSARFEAPVSFDGCEFARGATFENASFEQGVSFDASRVVGRLNLSRAVVTGTLAMKEVSLGGLDALGAQLMGDADFVDAEILGKVRFSLDGAARARNRLDPAPLLAVYRDYQGDDDAAEPLAARTSYGVASVDDLTARIDGNLRFTNAKMTGFVIFEGVTFGKAGADTLAEFYNTQFGGETHFERTRWNSQADFTTVYAQELAFNEATFERTLILDDANVPGRVTLTDARFSPGATLSFYGAQVGTLQIARDQVEDQASGEHRLWYARCARATIAPSADLRHTRQAPGRELDDAGFRALCFDRAIDEYTSLKQSFGGRAMTADEDWAYWWIKHSQTHEALTRGGVLAGPLWLLRTVVFELAFGWGVRLGNLAVTAALICGFFALLYRRYCPDTVMSYGGQDVHIRDIPWLGLLYISIQTLGGFNTGWDFGESDSRFRYLNTAQTFMGLIILTFFVGAYTRMILA